MADRTIGAERLLCLVFPTRRERVLQEITHALLVLAGDRRLLRPLCWLGCRTGDLADGMTFRRAERNLRRG